MVSVLDALSPFVHLEDPRRRHVHLPVNRRYKPLGITLRPPTSTIMTLRKQAMVFSNDPAAFDDIWARQDGGLWLYNDAHYQPGRLFLRPP